MNRMHRCCTEFIASIDPQITEAVHQLADTYRQELQLTGIKVGIRPAMNVWMIFLGGRTREEKFTHCSVVSCCLAGQVCQQDGGIPSDFTPWQRGTQALQWRAQPP